MRDLGISCQDHDYDPGDGSETLRFKTTFRFMVGSNL